jgi:cysteinyl-tRNA synthetase
MGEAFKGLRLHNTLTRRKEDFVPLDAENVRMYVCGPTVYDFAHIGNARPVIVFDVLFRLLRHLYGEDHVTYVRNITDVEDKINDRALRDFGAEIASGSMSLNAAIAKVTQTTADQFHKDVAALGCLEPTFEPRATQHIDGMVAMAQALIDKGHAYVASGNEGREVLFDVSTMPDTASFRTASWKTSRPARASRSPSTRRTPAISCCGRKAAKTSPAGRRISIRGGQAHDIFGRPGWHIECSVMSKHHLGEVFDIHGGGLDLIFPHHENEIAQSCCAHGTEKMANIWMHNGYLQVEGRKMSKSEGNFVTIHDLLHTEKFGGRKWPGEVLRLAMLMTHYREPIDFSVRRLEEAETLLRNWSELLPETTACNQMGELDPSFASYVLNDLNLYPALNRLSELGVRASSGSIDFAPFLAGLEILGISLSNYATKLRQREILENEDVERLRDAIWHRLSLLREKNFAEADRIRNELAGQGIQLMDYKDPETGERRTKWEVKR